MSFPGQSFRFPASSSSEPTANDPDPRAPLLNLSAVRERMDSLQHFLTESINTNAAISRDQLDMVSASISTAIRDVISNGAALISPQRPGPDSEIVEVDAAELVAEHFHYCEICGKGFKRDANLRMHMRAHGDRFKSPEALAKPESMNGHSGSNRINTRFSCPYVGCNRNQWHARFQALKSVICVKNHFKRSHCPKMYTCSRCNDKRFSVVADLKSHQKHCGEGPRWRCTCGTRFSRKCKLFGHVTLFEGHMPEVEDDKTSGLVTAVEEEKTRPFKGSLVYEDLGFSEEFFTRFGSIEGDFLEDMLLDLQQ